MQLQQFDMRYRNIIGAILDYRKINSKLVDVKRGARNLSYDIELSNPLQLKDTTGISENIALACRSKNVIAFRESGIIRYQIELPEHQWIKYLRGDDVNGLDIGLTDNKLPVKYSFNPTHSLVAGTTGAGKTYTTLSILLGLCEAYTPDELSIIICDPHGDFDKFENEEHVVKFEYGSIASSYEDIKSSISFAHDEMIKRIRAKDKSSKKIVLVVDEAESICEADKESLKKLVDIGNQARKFNIHLLITAKKPTQKTLPSLLNVLSNRWIGKCSLDKGSVTRLIGQSVNIQGLTGQGDFLHVDNDGVVRFLVASIKDSDFNKLKRGNQPSISFIDKKPLVELPLATAGRPQKQIQMKPLAYYWSKGPYNVTPQEAEELFGFSMYYHKKYCEYIIEFGKEFLRLKGK